MTVVRDQLFPQKPPGSRFRFSRTGVQPSPGSSMIELPSAFAESGAYLPDRELPGSPRQCPLPLACRHPPEGHQIGARKRRTPENTILSQPYCRRVSTDRPNREGNQLAASLEGSKQLLEYMLSYYSQRRRYSCILYIYTSGVTAHFGRLLYSSIFERCKSFHNYRLSRLFLTERPKPQCFARSQTRSSLSLCTSSGNFN